MEISPAILTPHDPGLAALLGLRSLRPAFMGPNGMDLVRIDPQACLTATFENRLQLPGFLPFHSQSGAPCAAVAVVADAHMFLRTADGSPEKG